jgi:HAD superfamily hydrolase (TIGR01509 family)
MIKGIFFDAADVFYARRESTQVFANRMLQELGYSTKVSDGDQARERQLHVLATEGKINHEEYWQEFLLIRQVIDAEQRRTLIPRILECSNDVYALPGGREALAGLKQRGFVLGVVTDTMYPLEWKMAWLTQVGVAEFIDVVACSTTLGAHKPNPELYVNAMQQAKLAPTESAFVGHDARELDGARRAGMKTVAVNYDPHAQADYYCKSLSDLLNVPIFERAYS